MGIIHDAIHGHRGDELQRESRSPGPVLLPIFGQNFAGHGVVKSVKTDYASPEGWGFHGDLTADCLNIRATSKWVVGIHKDSWALLYALEATSDEKSNPQGPNMLIGRLIITVHIIMDAVFFVPDPHKWAVYIPGRGDLSNAKGYLVPKPDTDAGGKLLRASLFRR